VLSGGRLRLGVGIGWNKVEYDAMGFDFHTRGKRIEEQITLLRDLWTKPLVKLKTEDHFIDDAGINPLPVQRPIPIWFGGAADVVLDRMARLGDGWMPNPLPMDTAKVMVEKIHAGLEANGRNPAAFGIDVRVSVSRQPASEWTKFVADWQALGATHAGINTMGAGYTSIEQHLHALRQFIHIMK
jgi:alkanesulfonate monooxygenase SsuD/methylene tetrahydromethanopterin reductase-like flavin-dependent oxidoreductase (luciferase family)